MICKDERPTKDGSVALAFEVGPLLQAYNSQELGPAGSPDLRGCQATIDFSHSESATKRQYILRAPYEIIDYATMYTEHGAFYSIRPCYLCPPIRRCLESQRASAPTGQVSSLSRQQEPIRGKKYLQRKVP